MFEFAKPQEIWDPLAEVLSDSIGNWLPLTDKDLLYLETAFLEIEEFWQQAWDQINYPRAVLIGEAPLYGRGKSYIYNPMCNGTAFLRVSDFGIDTQADASTPRLTDALTEFGVIVVEAFPYALPVPSAISKTYSAMPRTEYRRLMKNCFKFFLRPKLRAAIRINPELRILVRYKRLWNFGLKEILLEEGFQEGHNPGEIFCVASSNHNINKSLFRF